jgi:predicted ATPase/class 3 adenylate cyclase/DNA-binding NarL/FixJ family response regulator
MSAPPTGTVTFLFTDIEGSTKLAQQYPAQWEAARQRHHAILREAITVSDGYVFQVIGDGFCVAFHNASDAIAASVSAQRALQAEAWGETRVHVRMGLHTGPAVARDGEYSGYLTLAHVQRVMSGAYGGQVLLSGISAELTRGNLPDGLTLRDLGQHRLKGLLNPEHLWQLSAPDLSSDFPPLQSLAAIPNNLPIQMTSFIGREHELGELQRLLLTTRLLTLTGPGGTGKTRLSLQVATAVLGSPSAGSGLAFKDGVWFIELAPLSDPALLPQTVATTLGLHEDRGRPVFDVLTDYLRNKDLLLLLDNCEHLKDACAQLTDSLLRSCPYLRVLGTSREALNLEGERVYLVQPLTVPSENTPHSEAIRLFVARATQAHAQFALNEQNTQSVAQICQRLDGIPLAIELAAARVRVLSVQQIAVRLDDTLGLLTRGNAPTLRHQTMRAALDWSHDLLSETERALFRRLAIFAGSWDLDAAEQVCAFNVNEPLRRANVLDVLTGLIEQSLVLVSEHEATARYRLLEPVRQYALSKLNEAQETQKSAQQQLEYFVRFAEEAAPQLHRAQQQDWYRRLDTDYHNLRAAIAWAVAYERPLEGLLLVNALGWYWFVRGNWNEGYTYTMQALGSIDRLGPIAPDGQIAIARASALSSVGFLALWLGRREEAQALVTESIVQLRALGESSKRELSFALGHLAFASQWSSLEFARLTAEESIRVAREAEDPWLIARAQNVLALVLSNVFLRTNQGDLPMARRLAEESLRLSRAVGDQVFASRALDMMSNLARYQGDYAAAIAYVEDEISMIHKLGDMGLLPTALQHLAQASEGQGDFAKAEQQFEESLKLYHTRGSRQIEAQVLHQLGEVARKQNHLSKAILRYTQSMQLAREISANHTVLLCLVLLAAAAAEQKEETHAVHCLAQAEVLKEKTAQVIDILHVHAQQLASLRAQFPQDRFAQAWSEGRAMTLEQVIAEAEQIAAAHPSSQAVSQPATDAPTSLTAREVEVLRLLAMGLTNQQIADQLVLSRRTVHAHLRSIYGKIDVTTRNAATRVAMELKLV